MARNASALGHLGLMFGVLGVILMIWVLNNSVNPSGSGLSVLFFAMILWFVGLVFVVGEWFEAPRSP